MPRRPATVELLAALNPRTRARAYADVRARLARHVEAGRRVLVGFDFPYGYPHDGHAFVGVQAGARSPPWLSLWHAIVGVIEDHDDNSNNRFAVACAWNAAARPIVPFWGRVNQWGPDQYAELPVRCRRCWV